MVRVAALRVIKKSILDLGVCTVLCREGATALSLRLSLSLSRLSLALALTLALARTLTLKPTPTRTRTRCGRATAARVPLRRRA